MTAVTTRIEQALDLAAKGFYVFPAKAKDGPLIKDWPTLATTDAETIATWWGQWPNALVCIAPAKSGHTVIDIDVHPDQPSGFDSALMAGAPVDADVSNVSMGGEGKHLWYLGTNRNGQRVNGMEGVDSRSVGGYVVAHDSYRLPAASAITEPLPAKYTVPVAPIAAAATRGEFVAFLRDDETPLKEDGYALLASLVAKPSINHQDMLADQLAIKRLRSGWAEAIRQYRAHYCRGEWDTADWRKAFNDGLAGLSAPHPAQAITASEARAEFGLKEPLVTVSGNLDSMFVDLDDLDSADPPKASLVRRSDGKHLIYRGAVNGLVGDPEQGKSLVAAAMALEVARLGETTVWIDLDHNGAKSFRGRLLALGWEKSDGFGLFKFAQPEDKEGVLAVVKWAVDNAVSLAVIDSVGELLPMFGASSDSADDYTAVNRAVAATMARAGAAVLTIDHQSKGAESRAYGGTGTIAKKRAIDGAYYRVTAVKPFTPGKGGSASLKVLKDRHGSVREAVANPTEREPEAALWELESNGDWEFRNTGPKVNPVIADVARLTFATPPITSQHQARTTFGWGAERARKAWEEWKR